MTTIPVEQNYYPSDGGGLNLLLSKGFATLNGIEYSYPGGTVALKAEFRSLIYLDSATGSVTVNYGMFPPDCYPIAVVYTGHTKIHAIEDVRPISGIATIIEGGVNQQKIQPLFATTTTLMAAQLRAMTAVDTNSIQLIPAPGTLKGIIPTQAIIVYNAGTLAFSGTAFFNIFPTGNPTLGWWADMTATQLGMTGLTDSINNPTKTGYSNGLAVLNNNSLSFGISKNVPSLTGGDNSTLQISITYIVIDV